MSQSKCVSVTSKLRCQNQNVVKWSELTLVSHMLKADLKKVK